MHLDKTYGIPSYMAPMKQFWDDGKLAIMHGVGYHDSPRSHFRSMDIWHTCEPDKVGTEGWLGRVVREFDPKKENVVTAVSFGPSLFRALSVPGVPVACVAGPLETYGFLPGIQEQAAAPGDAGSLRADVQADRPGSGVMDYLGTTGLDFAEGRRHPEGGAGQVQSDVQYPNTPIARKLKGIAQVHFADLGTRVFYCDHGSFDTHAGQNPLHASLWSDVTKGLEAFMADLRAHEQVRQRDRADVLGVRPSRARQRLRHRSRRRRRGVRARRQGQGRPLRRDAVARRAPSWCRATSTRTWTSAASTRRFSTSGCSSTRRRSSTARTSSRPS